jgi:anthranilate phosphoribosyltransferase
MTLLKLRLTFLLCVRQAWELNGDEISTYTLHPTTDFGLPTHPLSSVRGATPDLNALTFKSLLTPSSQSIPPAHLSSPASVDSPSIMAIYDYVLLQSAALLRVSGRAKDYKEGVAIARETIESGAALRAFDGFKKASQEAMEVGDAVSALEDDGGVAAKGGEVMAWLKRNRTSSRNTSRRPSRENSHEYEKEG